MERVAKSADACLTALHIMTSPRMPKAVYIEDVIERLLQYTKFHLQNTLYPQYDPAYRVDPNGGQNFSSLYKLFYKYCKNLDFYELFLSVKIIHISKLIRLILYVLNYLGTYLLTA